MSEEGRQVGEEWGLARVGLASRRNSKIRGERCDEEPGVRGESQGKTEDIRGPNLWELLERGVITRRESSDRGGTKKR